jgi:hypothetical protein
LVSRNSGTYPPNAVIAAFGLFICKWVFAGKRQSQ